MRTEHRDQASFCPFALREVSVLAELALGHLRYSLTDVPPQSNSPPGSVLESNQAGGKLTSAYDGRRYAAAQTTPPNDMREHIAQRRARAGTTPPTERHSVPLAREYRDSRRLVSERRTRFALPSK